MLEDVTVVDEHSDGDRIPEWNDDLDGPGNAIRHVRNIYVVLQTHAVRRLAVDLRHEKIRLVNVERM